KNDVWRNFNITDSFEPGSIYKPIVVAAALEENVISTADRFYCGGGRNVADAYIRCHYTPGHGSETLEEVLANSCNVGMMEIVEKLGKDKYYKYQQEFGIGEKTGVDLPDEKSMSALVYKYDNINEVELATCSFGQGFNCTPLQDITAFSALINGGNIMRPYVVSQIVDEKENVIKEHEPEVVRKVISEDTSDFIRNALTKVFEEGGTGHKAAIEGYRLGGKTGTAEQGNRDEGIHTVDFIAYFPVENPKYIAMAVIHRPANYSDGVVSPAPMIKELFQDLINYAALPPDDEVDETYNDNEQISNILGDYTGRNLKETINELIEAGLDVEIAGAGGDTVKKQFPEGNSKINETTKVIIYTEKQNQETKLVKVPDVTGLTIEEADELLRSLGFKYVVQDDSENEEAKENEEKTETENSELTDTEKEDEKEKTPTETNSKTVHEQTPQSGVELESGTLIKLKIN
ncbi:MAG: PASTA domain-containing protein, partial [Firmicutes bacterium]|nr:PASTA domain-containing protein [Bacillota bacterium]